MAVVIGSNLRKEIAGSLLFEGVSFSVERGDRLSLSGPNGAGKTTLLRMLAGETEIHVAHDRWFLEAVTTAVLELEAGRSLFFPGPWHVWRLEKAHRAAAAAKTAERVGTDIARLERFVERFRYKKSKAKQAQAKLTQIRRLEKERSGATGELELLTRHSKSLGFDF